MQGQHVHDNGVGVSGSGVLGGADLEHANVIESNTTGVSVSGTVQFNRIADNVVGIAATGGELISRNLIYRNSDAGVLVRGAHGLQVLSNTFYAPQGDNVRIESGADVTVRNNILWAEHGYDIYVANAAQAGFVSDANDLYGTGAGRLVYWTKDFTDLLDWQADVARFDLHSIGHTVVNPDWAAPRFASLARDDYEVLGLVAGQRSSSPTIDAAGAAAGMGAYGPADGGRQAGSAPRIALRSPDLYMDWERGKPRSIRWDSYGNTTGAAVRIDLYQDGPDGPALLTTIAAATQDDGEFTWTPQTSGIDFGARGLRIQLSLVGDPAAIDRSTEAFAVPEAGRDYYVDDASNAGDEFTGGAVGSNRNTGKLPSAPKPNPVNVLRVYDLSGGDTLHVDTGDYALIDPIRVSGTTDLGLGLDEGFALTGPSAPAHVARLAPAIPGDRSFALIELNGADFVSVAHLMLDDLDTARRVLPDRSASSEGQDRVDQLWAEMRLGLDSGQPLTAAEKNDPLAGLQGWQSLTY